MLLNYFMETEDQIKLLRLTEAQSNNYFGPNSKFVYIAKVLGQEIIQDNFPEDSSLPSYDDFWEENNTNSEETKIGEFSDDHSTTMVGYQYDGLRFGIPLEIIYKENVNSVTVYWQGRIVYQEQYEELERYVSLKEWESKIEDLYKKTESKLKALKMNAEKTNVKSNTVDYEVQKIREKWGIK